MVLRALASILILFVHGACSSPLPDDDDRKAPATAPQHHRLSAVTSQPITSSGVGTARYAWVVVDYSPAALLKYKIQALVLFKSIHATGSQADCVLLCFDCSLPPALMKAASSMALKRHQVIPPLQLSEYNPAYLGTMVGTRTIGNRTGAEGVGEFAKLHAHNLTSYTKVVVLDADMLFRRNADELFLQPSGAHCNGPFSPLNAGLIVIEPKTTDYEDLVETVRRGNYSSALGWEGEGRCQSLPGWHLRTCAQRHIMQGLWHYWLTARRLHGSLLPRATYNALQDSPASNSTFEDISIVHFSQCGKPDPRLTRPPGWLAPSWREQCLRAHQLWQANYRAVTGGEPERGGRSRSA